MRFACACATLSIASTTLAQSSTPAATEKAAEIRFSTRTGALQLGVVGMVHGHVEGVLWADANRDDITIVGIVEPDRAVFDGFAAKYRLDPALRFDSLDAMLEARKPEAVSVMSSIRAHAPAAEICGPRGVHMLFEKPLAFSRDDAARIQVVSRTHHVLALTNFETSWYASVRESQQLLASGEFGPLRRLVFRHGHKGPREIGCSPVFVSWLADPLENGGGAIVDFGCYGAALSTWLMNGERPLRVAAAAATLKPLIYPKVDDDATIILTYPGATATIQASWCWTHDNKEMDVHAERGSLHAAKWDALSRRDPDQPPRVIKPREKPAHLRDEWTYLTQVVRGQCAVDPLSSLDLNVIVAEILDDARRQVQAADASQKP